MSNSLPSMSRAFMIGDMPPMFPFVPMSDNVYLCPWRTDDKKYFSTATATFVTATDIQPWLERYGRALDQVIESPVDTSSQHSPEGLHDYLVYSGLPLGEMSTPEELGKKWEDAVKARLDSFAQQKGYDNIEAACSYEHSTISEWGEDAKVALTSRDATWEAAIPLQPDVMHRTITIEQGLAQLPTLTWSL